MRYPTRPARPAAGNATHSYMYLNFHWVYCSRSLSRLWKDIGYWFVLYTYYCMSYFCWRRLVVSSLLLMLSGMRCCWWTAVKQHLLLILNTRIWGFRTGFCHYSSHVSMKITTSNMSAKIKSFISAPITNYRVPGNRSFYYRNFPQKNYNFLPNKSCIRCACVFISWLSLTNGNNLLYYLYNHPGLLVQNFFNLGESRSQST